MEQSSSILEYMRYDALMSDDGKLFSAWLQAELDRHGWSNSELARRINVRPGVVWRWARGKQRPRPEFAALIGAELGYSADYIISKAYGTPATVASTDAEFAHQAREVSEMQRRLSERLEEFSVVARDRAPRPVRIVGYVAADTVRWTAEEDLGMMSATEQQLKGAKNPVALIARGDCMRGIGIHAGDTIILDRRVMGREPRERELVVVRVGNERTFKRWTRDAQGVIRLLDGDDRVAQQLSIMDDFEVEAFYVTFIPAER